MGATGSRRGRPVVTRPVKNAPLPLPNAGGELGAAGGGDVRPNLRMARIPGEAPQNQTGAFRVHFYGSGVIRPSDLRSTQAPFLTSGATSRESMLSRRTMCVTAS
jgi:hypothetical protein